MAGEGIQRKITLVGKDFATSASTSVQQSLSFGARMPTANGTRSGIYCLVSIRVVAKVVFTWTPVGCFAPAELGTEEKGKERRKVTVPSHRFNPCPVDVTLLLSEAVSVGAFSLSGSSEQSFPRGFSPR